MTATLQLDPGDHAIAAKLLPVLGTEGRPHPCQWLADAASRPSHAMVHGGPFPATSDSRTTSVGTLAIRRFLRPVSYQDLPEGLLPAELQDEGVKGLPHLLDGVRKGN